MTPHLDSKTEALKAIFLQNPKINFDKLGKLLKRNGLAYLNSPINRYRMGDKDIAFDGQIFYKRKKPRG